MESPPKRRGRPRLDPTDETINVTIRMPARAYASACSRARVERVSVPELLRRDLETAAARDPHQTTAAK